jgi:hypothetical protein
MRFSLKHPPYDISIPNLVLGPMLHCSSHFNLLTDIDEDQEKIPFSDAVYLVESNPYCLTESPYEKLKVEKVFFEVPMSRSIS